MTAKEPYIIKTFLEGGKMRTFTWIDQQWLISGS